MVRLDSRVSVSTLHLVQDGDRSRYEGRLIHGSTPLSASIRDARPFMRRALSGVEERAAHLDSAADYWWLAPRTMLVILH